MSEEVIPSSTSEEGGPEEEEQMSSLVAALMESDTSERVIAIETIAKHKGQPKTVVPALMGLMNDPDFSVRSAAIEALGAFGPDARDAAPVLLKSLSDPYPQGAHPYATITVSALTSIAPVEDLMAALADTNPDIRSSAALILGKIGRPASKASPIMINMLADDVRRQNIPRKTVGECAVTGLADLGRTSRPVIHELVDALKHRNSKIRNGAARALGQIGRKARVAAPYLAKCLDDKHYSVRDSAAFALGEMYWKSSFEKSVAELGPIPIMAMSPKSIPKKPNAPKGVKHQLTPVPVQAIDRTLLSGGTCVIIVGVGQFKDTRIRPLPSVEKDAESFYAWATSSFGGGIESSRAIKLINEQATLKNIKNALKTWQPIEDGQRLLILYFAGQGVSMAEGEPGSGWFLPYDAQCDRVEQSSLSIASLGLVVGDQKARTCLVLEDTQHHIRMGPAYVGSAYTAFKTLAETRSGVSVISSSVALPTPGLGFKNKPGLFTQVLIKGLYGDADVNSNTRISLGELSLFLIREIGRESRYTMVPALNGSVGISMNVLM